MSVTQKDDNLPVGSISFMCSSLEWRPADREMVFSLRWKEGRNKQRAVRERRRKESYGQHKTCLKSLFTQRVTNKRM